jgi:hypothetical protein
VQEDGSDIFLGDIGLDRCAEVEELMENPKVDNATNLSLPPGHPDVVWTLGCEPSPPLTESGNQRLTFALL